ncbi:hypothetical protein J4E83_002405 [Alternaria metachromatica]|uniref:uncharacterized protein n=1 Tax=Alternaria metachromatica TaxID=283354 RepID=UPI0020C55B91|nr:uncharacterized protein J4E83_002405 [Alternaria metachromatica]KAI4630881.1 hypothetical protein J4E83_002405 [Alternaria metachromatica]
MAGTRRSSYPPAQGSTLDAFFTEDTTASPEIARESPDARRTPSPQPSEDGIFTKSYYEGLAERWGVTVAEFNYQEDRPRFWLRNLDRTGLDHDERLSPWALAYYDKYPNEMNDERTRNHYERGTGKPRVKTFVDMKGVTPLVRDNDGNFKPATQWQEVPDEPTVDLGGPSHWYTRTPKPRSNWLETLNRTPNTTGPQRPQPPARPDRKVHRLPTLHDHQYQPVRYPPSSSSEPETGLPGVDEGSAAPKGAGDANFSPAAEDAWPMEVDDDFAEGFEERLVDVDGDDFGDDLQDDLEDEGSDDLHIEPQNVLEDDYEDGVQDNAEGDVEDSIEDAPQASAKDDPIHDLEDISVLSDMSAPDEDLALQMYREDLEKIHSHLIKETRDSLWRSLPFDTREEYETALPLYNKGLPKLGNKEAEVVSLEDAMKARRDYDEYLRENMPKPADRNKEPEPSTVRRQPRRSTRNK